MDSKSNLKVVLYVIMLDKLAPSLISSAFVLGPQGQSATLVKELDKTGILEVLTAII